MKTKRSLIITLMLVTISSMFIIPQASAQYMPFYYPNFNSYYFAPYIPFAPPMPILAPYSLYPSRNAFALTPTPGGGTPLTLLLAATPVAATPVAVTPTIGTTTAIILAGGGGGINATTLALLTAPTAPAPTPTIGTTTLLLLGGGGINTTTLLLLGIL